MPDHECRSDRARDNLFLRRRRRPDAVITVTAQPPRRSLAVVWVASTVFAVAAGFMAAIWTTRNLAPGVSVNTLPSMVDCIQKNFDRIGTQHPDSSQLKDMAVLCWQQIRFQATLNDFEIRRLGFFQQYYSNPVLLWMVVVVTLSGVGLAGIQLLASYELAATRGTDLAANGTMVLDKGSITLKSSVTGIFILVMSFAFFIVFVKFIYPIDQVDVDHQPQAASQLMPEGRLGPPLNKESTPPADTQTGHAADTSK